MATDVLLERIAADPKVLAGKPVVRGTRVSVDLVIDLLARGDSKEQAIEPHNHLKMSTSTP